MKKITLLCCFLIVLVNNSFGQITLVKDIVTTDSDSFPSNYLKGNNFTVFTIFGAQTTIWASDGTIAGTVEIGGNINEVFNINEVSAVVGNTLYFVIENSDIGGELYKTDGTLAGTTLVKDINTNQNQGSDPRNFTVLNGKLYFTANDGNGNQLWATDGTTAGTTVLTATVSEPSNLITINNAIYFSGENPANGSELWKTDGTAAGTLLIKDINPGANGSFSSIFFNANNTLYFVADNGSNGTELWKSDGTEPGTSQVKDINPGNLSSFPTAFAFTNNTLFFVANNGTNGTELWKTDGTEAGTSMIKDINAGANSTTINGLLVFGNSVVFGTETAAAGFEPWISDGTEAGTKIVKDINPGANSSLNLGGDIEPTILNGMFYFDADNGTNGFELWKTDGTDAGTTMVKDINTNASIEDGKGIIGGLYLINNKLLFSAFSTTSNIELWETDGTEAGTVLLKDINPNKGWGTSLTNGSTILVNNKLFFSGNNGNDGFEPWVTDGTSAGTIQLKNIADAPNSSNPSGYIVALNKLFFAADSTSFNNQRLMSSDGTGAGTMQVNSILSPKAIIEFKGKVYISSADFSTDYGIFYTDMQGSKQLVKKINPNGFSNITEFYHFTPTHELYFAANNGTDGKELWKTDGTTAGTVLVKDLVAGADGNTSIKFTTFNNELYFMANKSTGFNTSKNSIWKTDGTNAGTSMLKEFSNINGSYSPYFTTYNNKLYFTTFDNSTGGNHLWETDGTIAGTIATFVGFDNPRNLVVIGNFMFMSASNNVNGQEMWTFDGTNATLFKEFAAAGASGYFPSEKYSEVTDGIYHFMANDGTTYSLWQTDGILANTTKIFDVPNNTLVKELVVGATHLYITFDDGVNGEELWKTDGTQAGTELVQNLYPGTDNFGNINSSRPNELTIFGTDLYFTATTKENGTELYKVANIVLSTDDFNESTIKNELDITLYPNPTLDVLKINSNQTILKSIQIFNLLGKEILNYKVENANQNTFDVSHLKTGLYILKINTDKESVTRKIVKN